MHCKRPTGHTQSPLLHDVPPGQVLPHAPQLCGFDDTSTQLRPHCTLAPQSAAQVPRRQTWFCPQATPQPPQFAGSLSSATHAPAHAVVPVGHTHWPAVQVWLGAHVAPHAPQFRRSLSSATHARLHAVRPDVHAAAHVPRSHKDVGLQTTSQRPQ